MADDVIKNNNDRIERARALTRCLEQGDEAGAGRLLEEMSQGRNADLFQELGKLTRQLHEALNSFQLDARLADIAVHDMPDAKDRLNYVIAMTEQAANRTLTAVEGRIPVISQLEEQAQGLHAQWGRFRQREMGVEEFRALSEGVGTFLARTEDEMAQTRAELNEVLMAQEFQDLTGQIIRRVIDLVHEVEGHLVDLVRISGAPHEVGAQQATGTDGRKAPARGDGPAIPGRGDPNVVSGQDDVDELLSSLGF